MSFSWGKGDLFGERLGKHVWADLIPLRRLLDAGLSVGCGGGQAEERLRGTSSWRLPFSGSGRQNLGPAQGVSRAEAVLMWTREAARVLGWEGIGTLAPGSYADLIVVDRDPLACPLEQLASTQVLLTVLGGTTVYDAGAL
jgi:predicted amidohydrolase YtcJ